MKLYLAGPMFTAAEVAHNLRLAAKLRDHGFEVFCPNESEPSSDKTRTDITPRLIYDVDIEAVESSNVLICQVSEDSGTNWESGYMDCLSRHVDPSRYYGVIGLATDIRFRTPPHPDRHGVNNQAFYINALVVGGLQGSLGVYLDEDSMIARLEEIRQEQEGELMTEPETPIVNIEGDLVSLGPLRRDLIPDYLRWINDFGTTRMLGVPPGPMTLEQESAWYETAATDRHAFTIYERATGRVIGNCGLHEVDQPNRRTVVGIMVGESEARGRGYGTEAMRLLLDYAFTVLGLHSVMLTVHEYNVAGRRCYEKVGFREIGRRRESRWFNDRFWDEIHMDILTSEFESPVLGAKLEAGLPDR